MMTANMPEEDFVIRVAEIIGREFEKEVLVLEITKRNYLILFDSYSISVSKDRIKDLKGPIGPYRLDRYILEIFMIQGFEFDKKRSQYIKYVFGVFNE